MKKKIKVAIIGCAGVPARYGGFETLAEQLIENLCEDFDFSVFNTTHNYPKSERPNQYKGCQLIYLPFKANGWQSIIYDSVSVIRAAFFADILLLLGVAGALVLPFVKLFSNKKIIVHPDGIEWKRAKWNKPTQFLLRHLEALAVKLADEIISDNKAISTHLQKEYNCQTTLIAYGGNHLLPVQLSGKQVEKYSFIQKKYALKICRIVPENNIELILKSFAQQNHWPLIFIGNWNNSSYGQELFQKYASNPQITLLDPIYDKKDLYILRAHASLYIHGHSAGGTNPTLVEAMHFGIPILAYDVAFNRATTFEKAMYFNSSVDLKKQLLNLQSEDYTAIGKNMKQLAEQHYTWQYISNQYATTFHELLLKQVELEISKTL